jgi:hypothetical protein
MISFIEVFLLAAIFGARAGWAERHVWRLSKHGDSLALRHNERLMSVCLWLCSRLGGWICMAWSPGRSLIGRGCCVAHFVQRQAHKLSGLQASQGLSAHSGSEKASSFVPVREHE